MSPFVEIPANSPVWFFFASGIRVYVFADEDIHT